MLTSCLRVTQAVASDLLSEQQLLPSLAAVYYQQALLAQQVPCLLSLVCPDSNPDPRSQTKQPAVAVVPLLERAAQLSPQTALYAEALATARNGGPAAEEEFEEEAGGEGDAEEAEADS